MKVAKRLEPFGETVFATWSRLAVEHNAINLGQGFPDFDAPDFVKEAAIKAIRDGDNQYFHVQLVIPHLFRQLQTHLKFQ